MEKSSNAKNRESDWNGTERVARHASKHRVVSIEGVRHSPNKVLDIVSPRFDRQDVTLEKRQMDIPLHRVRYEFTQSNEEIVTSWAQSQTFISFGLPFKPSDLLSNQVNHVPSVFQIARMTARSYVKNTRTFIGEHDNDDDRDHDSSAHRARHDKGTFDDYLNSPPYSINTVHLQNPYKTPQRLEGFATRNSNVKVRSRFFQKGPYRTIDAIFRPRNNNPVNSRRSGLATVKVHEADDDNKVGRSRRREIRLYLKKIALVEGAKQYCSNSSLHGLRYIGDATLTTLEKLFWLIAFIVAVLSAAYFIQNLYSKWVESPIIISLSPEPVGFENFPFPSVTICNMNNARKSEAIRIQKGGTEVDQLLLDDICNYGNTTFEDETIGAANWNNVKRFMINVSQPCNDMVKSCKWHGNRTECANIFNPTLTDEGMCCNFNSVPRELLFYNSLEGSDLNLTYPSPAFDWSPETGYNKSITPDIMPWRAYGAGKEFGLTLVLDADLNEYYCSSTHSVGFKMYLHNPVETPKIADFAFVVSPGKETRIVIKPAIASAQKSIQRVPKEKRRCYFTSERKLKYYRTYTQKNCLLECEANFTQKYCHCVMYYMPKSSNTPICGKKDDTCAMSARRAMESKLYDDDITVGTQNITKTPSCLCWPGCFEMNYDINLSSSQLGAAFGVEDLYEGPQPEMGRSRAIVHIFFADSQFPNYVKSELFGFIEFLSSTGGLLGLFMGFSFLSVAEVVYFITLRVWCRFYSQRKTRNQTAINILPANHNRQTVYPFAQ